MSIVEETPRSKVYESNAGAAEYLDCSENWLDKDRMNHPPKIPFFKLGTRIKYKIADLDGYMEANKVGGQEASVGPESPAAEPTPSVKNVRKAQSKPDEGMKRKRPAPGQEVAA